LLGFGQNVNIPDANFKAYLVGNTAINTNGDNQIQVSEASAFTGTITIVWMNISNLTGIEAFTALTKLDCENNQLTSLNLSQNTALTSLWCQNNQLTSLDVSANTVLTTLFCEQNQLTSLNVSGASFLKYLDCNSNQLTSLDVSQNTALIDLECGSNQISSLDVSGATALVFLDCHSNQLTSLNVSQNTALIGLECAANQLTSLNVSANTALTFLSFEDNQLECLDISNNINLEELFCNDNLLEQLNTRNGNWQNMYVEALNNNLSCVEVDNIGYANSSWVSDFDSFVSFSTNCNYTNPCVTVSAIQEQTTNKELLKITDLLGRETKATNQLLFYIYNDGTVEKKVVVE
jgi:hypothetical protein